MGWIVCMCLHMCMCICVLCLCKCECVFVVGKYVCQGDIIKILPNPFQRVRTGILRAGIILMKFTAWLVSSYNCKGSNYIPISAGCVSFGLETCFDKELVSLTQQVRYIMPCIMWVLKIVTKSFWDDRWGLTQLLCLPGGAEFS